MYKVKLSSDFFYYFVNEKDKQVFFMYNTKTKTQKLLITKYRKVAYRWLNQLNNQKGFIGIRG